MLWICSKTTKQGTPDYYAWVIQDEGREAGPLTELSWHDFGLDVLLVLRGQGQTYTCVRPDMSVKLNEGLRVRLNTALERGCCKAASLPVACPRHLGQLLG
jgi:hypothetical protein